MDGELTFAIEIPKIRTKIRNMVVLARDTVLENMAATKAEKRASVL
jgi:hypothetical protein